MRDIRRVETNSYGSAQHLLPRIVVPSFAIFQRPEPSTTPSRAGPRCVQESGPGCGWSQKGGNWQTSPLLRARLYHRGKLAWQQYAEAIHALDRCSYVHLSCFASPRLGVFAFKAGFQFLGIAVKL